MELSTSLVGQPLVWQQPSLFAPRYQLISGKQRLLTLNVRNSFTGAAIVDDGRQRFRVERRARMFQPTAFRVRSEDGGTELATLDMDPRTRSGTLRLSGRRKIRFITDMARKQWKFVDESGEVMLAYRLSKGLLRTTAQLEVMPAATEQAERIPAWLMAFGFYMIITVLGQSSL